MHDYDFVAIAILLLCIFLGWFVGKFFGRLLSGLNLKLTVLIGWLVAIYTIVYWFAQAFRDLVHASIVGYHGYHSELWNPDWWQNLFTAGLALLIIAILFGGMRGHSRYQQV